MADEGVDGPIDLVLLESPGDNVTGRAAGTMKPGTTAALIVTRTQGQCPSSPWRATPAARWWPAHGSPRSTSRTRSTHWTQATEATGRSCPDCCVASPRTAVVAGTATAVSGRVQRRQAERLADRDAQIYAERDRAYEDEMQPAPAAAPPPAEPAEGDVTAQLKQLAQLKRQGILTDDEFAAQKARILGG